MTALTVFAEVMGRGKQRTWEVAAFITRWMDKQIVT